VNVVNEEISYNFTNQYRLESLGALGHGDRRAGPSNDLSNFNLENKYGAKAVSVVIQVCNGQRSPLLSAVPGYKNFFEEMKLGMEGVGICQDHKNACTVSKFLNRILGMPTSPQNDLFLYFSRILSSLIAVAKKMGKFDQGILGK
jgi:hypothetical protein